MLDNFSSQGTWVVCGGCGRQFRPDATRKKFCDHDCYAASLRVDIQARFWSKVNKNDPSGCWLWTAATIKGYGQIAGVVNGKKRPVYAHRVSWELAHGLIPDSLQVLHNCPSGDNPLCVNPAHLFLGTQPENLEDARQKGRLIDGAHLIKLSDDDLAAIRRDYRPRQNGKQLAAQYGVSLISIMRVIAGTQRVQKAPVRLVPKAVRGQAALDAVFERVSSVELPIAGEVA